MQQSCELSQHDIRRSSTSEVRECRRIRRFQEGQAKGAHSNSRLLWRVNSSNYARHMCSTGFSNSERSMKSIVQIHSTVETHHMSKGQRHTELDAHERRVEHAGTKLS